METISPGRRTRWKHWLHICPPCFFLGSPMRSSSASLPSMQRSDWPGRAEVRVPTGWIRILCRRSNGWIRWGRPSVITRYVPRSIARPKWATSGAQWKSGSACSTSQFVPLVVGAPSLKRYTVFGNLFAAVDGVVYRIDRHPTMKCHPVTPMSEADLRLHLKAQTDLRIGLLDTLQLDSTDACEQFRKLGKNFDSVLIDVANEAR